MLGYTTIKNKYNGILILGKHMENSTSIRSIIDKLDSINHNRLNESLDKDHAEYNDEAGMAENNLNTLKRAIDGLDEIINPGDNLPEWCQEKIAVAKSMLVAVWDYMASEDENDEETYDGDSFYEAYGDIEESLVEAEYHGRKVTLNKPMQGDVKKFKVFVKDPKTGNVKKVNFGDPNMRIKKSNPARRKSFRARHNCDTPGPKTKARYWSCRKW